MKRLCLYDESTLPVVTNNSFARTVALDVVAGAPYDGGRTVYDVTFAPPDDSLPVQTSLLDSGLASLIDE